MTEEEDIAGLGLGRNDDGIPGPRQHSDDLPCCSGPGLFYILHILLHLITYYIFYITYSILHIVKAKL